MPLGPVVAPGRQADPVMPAKATVFEFEMGVTMNERLGAAVVAPAKEAAAHSQLETKKPLETVTEISSFPGDD